MKVKESVLKAAQKLKVEPDLLGWSVGKYHVEGERCSCKVGGCTHVVAVKLHNGEEVVVEENVPDKCVNGLDRWEVISAFHKELRRGDKEAAWYWLETMIQSEFSQWYMTNYIVGVLSEELCTCDMKVWGEIRALAEYKNKDPYRLYAMVEKFCEAKKWWFCQKCSDRRLSWVQTRKDVKAGSRPVPFYAYDPHTDKGKRLAARGHADLRWSGTWPGVMWRMRAAKAGLDLLTAKWNDVDMSDEEEFWEFERS